MRLLDANTASESSCCKKHYQACLCSFILLRARYFEETMTSCKDLLITKKIETTFYSIMESVERRNVIAKFVDDMTGPRLSNDDGDTLTRTAKFRLAKQQLCVCITLFLYISSLHYCDMKLPNFTCPLYGVDEHNTTSFFFFFRYHLSD